MKYLPLAAAAALGLCAGACANRPISSVDPTPSAESLTDVTLDVVRDFDILFVVDNSLSMAREQASLAANFPRLVQALDHPVTGLPSLHIGVVTTDMGGGESCAPNLDAGDMVGAGCGGLTEPFIRDIANDDGTRTTNYTGTLADTFACMADVGTGGCGFEQPFEAMRRALENNPANAGFLREHAFLAVIFVTDEDDCSARDDSLFDSEYVGLDHPLGPRESFRCFEFGVTCEGGDLRSPGAKENCAPDEDSAYLHKVGPYVDFLYGLKQFPQQVFVGAISGSLSPVIVEHLTDPNPPTGVTPVQVARVKPSCENGNADAVPPIRINSLLQAFPGRQTLTSICDEDLTAAVDAIGKALGEQFDPCIKSDLIDINPDTPELDLSCSVSELQLYGTKQQTERLLGQCDNPSAPESSTTLPCYLLQEQAQCSAHPTGLALHVAYPPGYTIPPGTHAVARCLAR